MMSPSLSANYCNGDPVTNRTILIVTATLIVLTVTSTPFLSHAADAPATAPTTAPSEAGVQRFYGAITAVDTKANTFVVDGQTYTVVGESQMTKAADNSQATLADAVVGEPARGSYTKAADGTLRVTKVRFGKKTGGKSGGGKSGGKKKDPATQPVAG